MTVVRSVDIKENFSKISQIVYSGETVLITRPHKRNLVLITEADYNANYKKTVESRRKQTGRLTDPKDRRKAISALDGLLAGDDVSLDDIRSERRAKRYGCSD